LAADKAAFDKHWERLVYDVLIRNGMLVDGTGSERFKADIAIAGGKILAIEHCLDGDAREVIDADGKIVTPGFIDAHTHYDGQVSWDSALEPSAPHGVTTAVMGNCGVGFAPVRPEHRTALMELMEGVEDIPGTALAEGITWNWTTFPDYLEELGRREFSIDIAAQIAHGPLRLYVMGERALNHEAATSDDIAAMCGMVAEALAAGAVGFSTSRVLEHQSLDGNQVPGTFAPDDELIAISESIRRAGRGILQVIPAGSIGAELNPASAGMLDHERELLSHVALSGVPVLFCLFQPNDMADEWRDALSQCEQVTAAGGIIHGMVAPRPISILSCWDGFHIFARRPSYVKISGLPLEERVEELRKPEVKAAILSETDLPPRSNTLTDTYHLLLQRILPSQFVFSNDADFEPEMDKCIEGLSRRTGKSIEECAYDAMMERDGTAHLVAMSSYALRDDFEDIREMLAHPNVLPGLSDGGAHVCLICDASLYSFMLSFWSRDRVRGPHIPLERVVQMTTQLPASVYGMADRGTLEVGKRADINVIDFEKLQVGHPRMAHDLPLGSKRLLQGASGYVATLVNGVVTRRNDEDTGARPGRLVRDAGHHADMGGASTKPIVAQPAGTSETGTRS